MSDLKTVALEDLLLECLRRVMPPVKLAVDPPDEHCWRPLLDGETVETGDEIFQIDQWFPVGKTGFPYKAGAVGPIRRRCETLSSPVTEHHALADAPFRALLDGEFVEEGDEEYYGDVWPYRKEWKPVRSWGYYYGSKIHAPHRRRNPAPVRPKLVYMPLQNGDLIWETDEYLSTSSGDWEKTTCYGEVYNCANKEFVARCHRPHRRLFAEGYRWLRAGDVVINGDEILENGIWSPIDETGAYDSVLMKPVRRKTN